MGTALRINIETGVEELIEVPDAAPVVPHSVPRRQALLALDAAGILDDVESMIMNGPRSGQIEWDAATEFRRGHPLILAIGSSLGLSENDIDELFIAASNL